MQNSLFLSAEIFLTHIFQVPFHDFRQESDFLALLMVKKAQGLLFTFKKGKVFFFSLLKKGRVHFLLLIKWGVGAAPPEKRKHERY